MRRSLMLAAGPALGLVLGACGPDGDPCAKNPLGPGCGAPTPTPTPIRVTNVIDQGQGPFPALVALLRPLNTTTLGTIDATVDWTFDTNDIDVFLMRGTCTFAQLVADQCTIVVSATGTVGKREQIRADNQPAGAYTFVVANFGPGDDSIAYQVRFTNGAAASSSAARGSGNGGLDGERRLLRGINRVQ